MRATSRPMHGGGTTLAASTSFTPQTRADSDSADLLSPGRWGPASREVGAVASDWWLPGDARLCLVRGEGTVSVQLRHRRFVAIPRVALIGPSDRAHQLSADGAGVVSFGLTPLGWSRLFRKPAARYRNLVVGLDEVARPSIAARLTDLLRTVAEAPVAMPVLQDMVGVLAMPHRDDALIRQLSGVVTQPAATQVGDMPERLGLTESRLRALALRHFGSPTKILLRRERFLRSLARVDYTPGHNSYSNIDPSYHDVSHFLRDAEYFLGTTPRRFRLLSSQH